MLFLVRALCRFSGFGEGRRGEGIHEAVVHARGEGKLRPILAPLLGALRQSRFAVEWETTVSFGRCLS